MAHDLSTELYNEIFSQIDLRADLINVACACRSFASLILPLHSEYRVIRAAGPVPWIWTHLVGRPDLARNIREIYLGYFGGDSIERLPTSLVKEVNDNDSTTDDLVAARTMAAALVEMTRLEVISWGITEEPVVSLRYQHIVLQAMTRLSPLKSLTLLFDTKFSDWSQLPEEDSGLMWDLPNLKVVYLGGNAWTLPCYQTILGLTQSSQTLETLSIPGIVLDKHHSEINLPSLKELDAGFEFIIDPNISHFLKRHTSVETLTLAFKEPLSLLPGTLPHLRSLTAPVEFLRSMEASYQHWISEGFCPTPWRICKLNVRVCLAELLTFTCLDRGALHHLHVRDDSPEEVRRTGELFTNIKHISVAPSKWILIAIEEGQTPFDEWVKLLASFKNVETFMDVGPYSPIAWDDHRLRAAVFTLASLCPKLQKFTQTICAFENSSASSRICIKRRKISCDTTSTGTGQGTVVLNGELIWYEVLET
ncbi:hypothetical protein BDN72DRAFT_825708 [Pluteus cervinus]|uniref:Uncharacterized protein n=1 Tax=Pluteus cervinus TaxID=181527 RepID=A0ACD3AF89_9AGAR|nr:hypothetical protein BDN72DRAFT_825708 [Pluteus cervinus]